MTARPFIILALLLSFVLGGAAVWVLKDAGISARESTSRSTPPQAQGPDHQSRAEKFFGGDPDRNVRSGQEMKPRW